ncbi:MAG: hypothetical protein AB9917_13150 [Negativicutes bacterium]
MIISLAGLFLLVLACLSLGACAGMVVMALCRVSAEESRREEAEGLKESY